jgi:predicted DNA-binding transcriptional regulator AlpA
MTTTLTTPLLSPRQVATLLGCSTRTFFRIVEREPDFPKPHRLSRKLVRWSKPAVEAWLAERQKESNNV